MKNIKIIFLIITLLYFKINFSSGLGPTALDEYAYSFYIDNQNNKKSKLNNKLIEALSNYNSLTNIISKKLGYKDERLENIKALIKQGANINLQNHNGGSLLHKACNDGYFKMVKILINLGIDLNIQNHKGQTALIIASKFRELGYTCSQSIDIATKNNYLNIIKFLIMSGADYQINDSKDKTCFYYADEKNLISIKTKESKVFIKTWIWKEKKENIINQIFQAIDNDSKDEVKQLLLKGYKYFYDLDQNNMLHIAALKNKFEIFKLILKAAPELITEKNKDGITPLELNPEILIKFMPQIKLKLEVEKIDIKEEIVDEYEDNLIVPEACNII